MEVISFSPLPAASVVWQSGDGSWTLTVLCKATFELTTREMTLAEKVKQLPLNRQDHWQDGVLLAPTDLVPYKPRADVLLVGHAFAPNQPARSLFARVSIGALNKNIHVWCNRWFDSEGRLREGPPFEKMPITYDRAAGGFHTSNPAGISLEAVSLSGALVELPNLQPPAATLTSRADRFDPTSFAPVAPSWAARRSKLRNRLDLELDGWMRSAVPTDPDFFEYFQAAPPDQQIDEIRPGLLLLLEHLHPHQPRFRTTLANIQPQVELDHEDGRRERFPLVGDTLWIHTDRALCTITWRRRIAIQSPDTPVLVSITVPPLPLSPSSTVDILGAAAPGPLVREEERGGTTTSDWGFRTGTSIEELGHAKTLVDLTGHGADAERVKASHGSSNVVDPAPGIDGLPVDVRARIAVEIGCDPAGKTDVLARYRISPPEWELSVARWSEEIRLELLRGETGGLYAYDEAYSDEVERRRGRIDAAELSRLAVAAEQGALAEVAAEMRLPRDSFFRLLRVWMRRASSQHQLDVPPSVPGDGAAGPPWRDE
ncbi:MAG: DUF2169 domain-containing protein [Polyangiaceae bacterium]